MRVDVSQNVPAEIKDTAGNKAVIHPVKAGQQTTFTHHHNFLHGLHPQISKSKHQPVHTVHLHYKTTL